MLHFSSSSNGLVDSARAIEAAVDDAATRAGRVPADCRLVVFHVTMGHDEEALLGPLRRLCPDARIVGCTVGGIIGREGANEHMHALALMMTWGDEGDVGVAVAAHLDGDGSRDASEALARHLLDSHGPPRFVMFLGSGIDIDVRQCIDGIEAVLGEGPTIFGGTSADNMKGLASYQLIDDAVHEHAAVLIGFYDPRLRVHTQASHGFTPLGVEMTVTRSSGHRVLELDGEPAWERFTRNLGLPPDATPADTIPPGAVGVALDPDRATEYGDSHLLRAITHQTPGGGFLMPVTCPTGTRLALMQRDEERIFRNLDVMMGQIRDVVADDEVVAVFHADCGARGRLTLDRVAKDEIVEAMQSPLRGPAGTPAWIGMYGFGEIARLGGRNTFHNYTTALYVIIRGRETDA
jgi:hypothetical protein